LLLAYKVEGHLVSRQTRWINGTLVMGNSSFGPLNSTFIASTIEPGLNQDGVLITRCTSCKFQDMYWEFGNSSTTPTTGFLIDIPSTAALALGIVVDGGFVTGSDHANTSFAFNANLASAQLTIENTFFSSFANPAFIVDCQAAAQVGVYHNQINSPNMGIFNGCGGITADAMDNFEQTTGKFLSEYHLGPTVQFAGEIVQPGVAASAILPTTPTLGTQQFCQNCVPTTAASCSTATPASCICIAGTGQMWARYENFMNNGNNWYCH
jgi:hypothetical protein